MLGSTERTQDLRAQTLPSGMADRAYRVESSAIEQPIHSVELKTNRLGKEIGKNTTTTNRLTKPVTYVHRTLNEKAGPNTRKEKRAAIQRFINPNRVVRLKTKERTRPKRRRVMSRSGRSINHWRGNFLAGFDRVGVDVVPRWGTNDLLEMVLLAVLAANGRRRRARTARRLEARRRRRHFQIGRRCPAFLRRRVAYLSIQFS